MALQVHCADCRESAKWSRVQTTCSFASRAEIRFSRSNHEQRSSQARRRSLHGQHVKTADYTPAALYMYQPELTTPSHTHIQHSCKYVGLSWLSPKGNVGLGLYPHGPLTIDAHRLTDRYAALFPKAYPARRFGRVCVCGRANAYPARGFGAAHLPLERPVFIGLQA